MAFSTSTRYGTGAAQGVPQVGVDFNKFDMHKEPKYQVGFKVEDVEGNVYRYAHFGADTNRGVLVSQDLSESCFGDSDNVIVASASTASGTDGAIGTRFIEVTMGDSVDTISADQFAGGRFITSDDAGEGYTYDIVGNTANSTSGSAVRFQLKQPLQVAVTAATDFIIVGNRFSNLEIATSATDNFVAGVTCSTMDVSEKPYGWIQTKGVAGILSVGFDLTATMPSVGDNCVLSDGTSGSLKYADSVVDDGLFFQCIVPGDTTGHGAYYFNLD